MCLADVARFTGLGWDTVKELVQERLEADYGRPDLRGLRYLVHRRDLRGQGAEVLHRGHQSGERPGRVGGPGQGGRRAGAVLAAAAAGQGEDPGRLLRPVGRLLERGGRAPAQGGGGVRPLPPRQAYDREAR